ncbi:glycosyltransferase family 4 protein [Flavobacterium sp.]|uniref:glycosyltransferase family 4 protein n=1 Tax=Flavobacterium sp. TaxID=239 RepID=UPI00260E93D4|nr:glycosyltransferase family 4 protein [Flavobacterium sp.]
MKNILFIHQSAELYGSDKTLLLLLKHIDKSKFNPIVILPFEGPLKVELENNRIKVVIAPVLKLYRKMFTPKNIFQFFKDIKKSFNVINDLNEQYNFDLIYSNTLAVLLGVFYAKKSGIKHLWHVHEIIESPKFFTKIFCKMLSLNSNSKIVYNSIATKKFWDVTKKISLKSEVVWNGLEVNQNNISKEEKEDVRKLIFKCNSSEIIIALVGRISRWKGQKILLNSFNEVLKTHQNIKLALIGSTPPNQEFFLYELEKIIIELNISDKVIHIPFTKEIAKIWQCIDIAVVPSIEPEPFGLVAVEAMLAKKPVIGSNHGGLTEIILNNETGFLVKPKDEIELENAISKLIEDPKLRQEFGENGYNRAVENFSISNYVSSFEKIFINI